MKRKKRRILSILLTAAMLCSTWQMPVAAESAAPSQDEISTQATENGVTVTTQNEFMTALKQNQSPITVNGVITIGDEADTSGRMLPVMIPANTIIQGTEGSSINSRAPIQLAGDGICFQNIEFTFSSSNALGSVPHREIFLAGHSLTLDNVSTYLAGGNGSLGNIGGTEEELLPSVYAGGYPNTSIGTNASLTIKNSNSKTMFKAIYMGHDAGSDSNIPYTGNAVLNLDHKVTVREDINTRKNTSATINVTGEGNAKSLTYLGNKNTTLTVCKSSMHNAVVIDIGNLILTENAYFLPKTASFQNITNIILNKNACLDLYNIPNAIIGGNFTGGNQAEQTDTAGILVLHEEGVFTINGTVTGNTILQTNNRNFPGTMYGDHTYISATRTGDAENFILPDTVIESGYWLEYQTNGWVVCYEYYEEEPPAIERIEVPSAPLAVDLADIVTDDYNSIPDDSIFLSIDWYDTAGNKLSTDCVEYHYLYWLYDYVICIKTEDWTSEDESILSNENWANNITLIGSNEHPGNYYFQAQDDSKTGNYTFLFCSESIYDATLTTVADVKEAVKDIVKAEVTIHFFDSSANQENPNTVDISSNDIYVSAIPDQTFTGNMILPSITVTNTATDNELVYGEDYLLTYKNNVHIGTQTASVTVNGIGSYTGQRTLSFSIVKSDADVTLTATTSNTSSITYGDTIRFMFQALPKGVSTATITGGSTVKFYYGNELLGTAELNNEGQAIFNYRTTEQTIPTGTSTIYATFDGTTELNANTATTQLTLKKQTIYSDNIKNISLNDITYNGSSKTTDILFITLADDTLLYASGVAELSSVNVGTYTTANVLNWSLNAEDNNWYQLPSAPDTIAVEPKVHILKADSPAPVTIDTIAQPNSTNNNISLLHELPATLQNEVVSCTLTKETFNSCISGTPTLTDDILTFNAGESGSETITVLVTLKNYQPMTVQIHVTVSEKSGDGDVPPHAHSYTTQVTKVATCTETGIRTFQCSGCSDSYTEDIPALQHSTVTDAAVAPTCTVAGLTEGSHCATCGTVLKAQDIILAMGHVSVIDNAIAPSCTVAGLTEGSHCATCGTVLKAQDIIPAMGHVSVIDNAIAPSCTVAGLTEGSHCATCGTVLKAQETIPAIGHQYVTEKTKATTTQNGGTIETCTVCGTQNQSDIIYAVSNISLSKTSYTYNGKVKKPSVIVKDSTGQLLKKGVDYHVRYSSGRKNVGIYTVTVTLKGNYTGNIHLSFSILPKGTTISKVTAKSKGFLVKWKKQTTQTSGYEVQYSTTKTFTKKTTKLLKVNSNKITTKTFSKLKAKKTYYVRIRTYKNVKVNGTTKKIYSNWSKTMKVITKK